MNRRGPIASLALLVSLAAAPARAEPHGGGIPLAATGAPGMAAPAGPPGDAAPAGSAVDPPSTPPAIEIAGGVALVLAADPRGDGAERRLGWGLRAGVALPLLPRPWFVRAEGAWLHVAYDDGTRGMNVDTTLDTFGLPVAAGYEWDGAGFWFGPYLAAGPSLVRTGIGYHVDDPLGAGPSGRDVASYDVGAVYGGGGRVALAAGRGLALSLRVEALMLRRGVADDLALGGTLGVLF